jgi:CHASE2 domain-containing sensor protein
MTINEGWLDRTLRVVVGLALIAFAYYGVASYGTIAYFGWIGVVPLVTGLVGWCPVYSLMGIGTQPPSHA